MTHRTKLPLPTRWGSRKKGIVDKDSPRVCPLIEETREKFDVMPRRSTRVRRAPDFFEDYAKVAVVDPVSLEEAIERTDRVQWKAAIEGELKCIHENDK